MKRNLPVVLVEAFPVDIDAFVMTTIQMKGWHSCQRQQISRNWIGKSTKAFGGPFEEALTVELLIILPGFPFLHTRL